MRDCDALVRFTVAAALACNDFEAVLSGEEQFQILGEIGCAMYDVVAFYKHRAEGRRIVRTLIPDLGRRRFGNVGRYFGRWMWRGARTRLGGMLSTF